MGVQQTFFFFWKKIWFVGITFPAYHPICEQQHFSLGF